MYACQVHIPNIVCAVIVADLTAGPREESMISTKGLDSRANLPIKALDLNSFAILNRASEGDWLQSIRMTMVTFRIEESAEQEWQKHTVWMPSIL
jgi:hypothetical protein